MTNLPFDCSRTCPMAGERWCRFRPLLDTLGSVQVCSHTTKIKVEYSDPDQLRLAVQAMGGTWLGMGTHDLYESNATGYGWTLPGWTFPIVQSKTGELHYDDYKGRWGNVADLQRLKSEYAASKTELECVKLGWQCERTAEGLRVYHPSGGVLDLRHDMTCDTTGFVGSSCHEARLALGLAADGDVANKAEYGQTAARVSLPQV